MNNFFEVDKSGLAKIAGRRGKSFVLYELIQNAWDTNASRVDVSLKQTRGTDYEILVTDDDPQGFKDLSHSFTLFAESEKKSDKQKRGRFNLGEKLVLALCDTAEILSTTGGVIFDKNGRHTTRRKLPKGSSFRGSLKLKKEEYAEICLAMSRILIPDTIETVFNGKTLAFKPHDGVWRTFLQCEVADAHGYLKRGYEYADIRFYKVLPGEKGTLYEMGIPVCETGDGYDADVQQKIPLNMERDGVSASYLRDVRSAMLNAMHGSLDTVEAATAPWVRDAFGDSYTTPEAAAKVILTRFGDSRVSYDPSDPEANNIAVSKGMTVVHGGSLSTEEWDTSKRLGLLKPAGQVTPSPKPFTPGGRALKVMPEAEWTPAIRRFVEVAVALAKDIKLGDQALNVQVADDKGWGFLGTYGGGLLRVNYGQKTMRQAIENSDGKTLLAFLIHEFAHHYESNHLTEAYHEACCTIGAQLVGSALVRPGFFSFAPTRA